MARYSATWSNITATAVADTVAFTAGQCPGFLRSGAAGVKLRVNEVSIGGMDTASTPTEMIVARTSTISVGALSVGNSGLLDVDSTAPGTVPAWGSTAATTFPQRSSTLYLLILPVNTLGGLARWQARPGEEFTCQGTTATAGEILISSKTGAGKTSGHLIYEVI